MLGKESSTKLADVLPIHRVGDEITFKYEGNVRAVVEGFQIIDGVLWFTAYTTMSFEVPAGIVLHVERKDEVAR